MTGQRVYPVFTMVKSLSSEAKRDSSEKMINLMTGQNWFAAERLFIP
jgi:hypothetical protein